MKPFKFIFYNIVLILLIVAGVGLFLLATTPGLETSIKLVNLFIPGKIEARGVTGALIKNFSFTELRYTNQALLVRLTEAHFGFKGNLSDFTLDAKTHIASPLTAEWQMNAHIKHQQARVKSTLDVAGERLKTLISANSTLRSSNDMLLDIIVSPGIYRLPKGSSISEIPFQGGNVHLLLNSNALNANGLFRIDAQKTIHLTAQVPQFHWDNIQDQNLKGKLNLHINTLDFIQDPSNTIENLHGQLQLTIMATGKLAKPFIKGDLSLIEGSVSIPKSGLTFSPIQATVRSSQNLWQAQGTIVSNGQTLSLQGQGKFWPEIAGKINVQGNHFAVMKTDQYYIEVSPQLTLVGKQHGMDITGKILVPNAQIKPILFTDAVHLSDDVVFVDKQTTEPAIPYDIKTDVQIIMGDKVELNMKGLTGFLDGTIQVQQQPKNALNARGELTIRNGKYHAYGQDLSIEKGQLLFTGQLENPGLNIRAVRKFNNSTVDFSGSNKLLDFDASNAPSVEFGKTTVGIQITGRLNSNKVSLFSIPANLSQSDILSMLILGKPANQANKAGGQLLVAAISSMNLDSGTKGMQLIDQLKQKLGIDFNLQNNSLYNQQSNQVSDNTALSVGKAISKRLYLSYNIGILKTDNNVLILKYLLNKFLSIQANASDSATGVDLLYTH